jgi:hypothetical protein
MRLRRGLLSLLLTTGLVAAAPGCKQSQGERCQVNDDCQDGLTCYTGQSQAVPPEGECQPPSLIPTADAGVAVDAPASDVAAEDALAAEDGAPDATAEDAAEDDATSPEDAAPDA